MKIYPWIHCLYEASSFFFQFKYLISEKFLYYKPYQFITKLLILRMTPQEAESSQPKTVMGKLISNYNVFILFLFVKFCEWYFSQRQSSQNSANQPGESLIEKRSRIPPPKYEGVFPQKEKQKCPLCKNRITNPAYLDINGFCFCYKCITDYILERERCPITNAKCGMDCVKKIYDS